MIDTTHIKLLYLLRERKIPTEDEIAFFRSAIDLYVYPLGVMQTNSLYNNINYESHTFIENINFFNEITSILYNGIYTTEELEIINIFFSLQCETGQTLTVAKQEILSPILQLTSNKKEIEYCLDEIRFYYLLALVHLDSNDTEQINALIEQLASIEEEHNLLHLDKRRNEFK